MIGMLRGRLVSRDGSTAILDVQGVGYELHAPTRALDAWAAEDGEITAIISTQVREDAITLFAFEDATEKVAFLTLLGVNKVGAKLAIATLNTLALPDLVRAVETGDVAALCRIPGVGKRTAQRLALELKGKLPAGAFSAATPTRSAASAAPSIDTFALALERLGWSRAEIDAARERVAEAGLAEDAPVGQRVRIALQSSLRS